MRRARSYRCPLLVLAVAAVLSGCDEANTLPNDQIAIVNLQDSFSWSVADLDNVTDAKGPYLWTVSGTQVTVDVTQAIGDGSAFLQIRDGAGVVVYAEDIGTEVDGNSDVGAQGLWQIDVVLTKVSGGFSFSVIRTP